MPTYRVTDPTSGKTVKLTGDSPPTEEELEQIFGSIGAGEQPEQAPAQQEEPVPQWGRENPNLYGAYGAGKAILSQAVKPSLETAGMIVGAGLGGPGGGALGYGIGKKTAEMGESAYASLEKEVPQQSIPRQILGSAVDVGSAYGLGKTLEVATRLAPTLEDKLRSTIKQGLDKAIRPSVSGKGTATQLEGYYDKGVNAVINIIRNKGNLKLTDDAGEVIQTLPTNLKQFGQAIDQTKKTIFEKYDALTNQTQGSGIQVDLGPIVRHLNSVSRSKVAKDLTPNVVKHSSELAQRLAESRTYTATEAQDAIARLNNGLEAFYKNPTYENASIVSVDAMVANNLRKGLDRAVNAATGQNYQELKNIYGSLSAIEKEVSHRAIVDARKNIRGLIDFSDIFSGAEVVRGILSLNPVTIGTGTAARIIASTVKHINNPNRIVKSMFKDTNRMLEKPGAANILGFRGGETSTMGLPPEELPAPAMQMGSPLQLGRGPATLAEQYPQKLLQAPRPKDYMR